MKNTEWGRKYNYKDLSIKEFQNTVPISCYEDLFPYISRMMKGEKNVLWPGKMCWFSKSSGTTNARSKFVPVSKESLKGCHFKGGKDMIALYIKNVPETKILRGKTVGVIGSLESVDGNDEINTGDISAVITKNLPVWVQFLRTPHLNIALMKKWEDKIGKITDITSKENVRSIAGVPTWEAVLIEKVLKEKNARSIFEVWPEFELVMHGGVSFKPYKPFFNNLFKESTEKKIHFMELYNASEGFFAIQDDLTRDDMLLMLDYGIFYEFIPMSEFGKENPKTVLIDEVEIGVNYAVVISTNGGLARYLIGDTVRFTTLLPHRIKITGRTKHFINAFGEELVVENAEDAIEKASVKTNCIITKFTAAPIYYGESSSGAHEWLVEFEKMPDSIEEFKNALDSRLREINSDYDAKRGGDFILKPPVITIAKSGVFYEWLNSRGKMGGQNKVPRLSNTREYIDEILGLMK